MNLFTEGICHIQLFCDIICKMLRISQNFVERAFNVVFGDILTWAFSTFKKYQDSKNETVFSMIFSHWFTWDLKGCIQNDVHLVSIAVYSFPWFAPSLYDFNTSLADDSTVFCTADSMASRGYGEYEISANLEWRYLILTLSTHGAMR